jgi:putative oxidoreductase
LEENAMSGNTRATPVNLLYNPDLGLLIIRLMFGVVGVYHGSQKLFGAWGGVGIDGFSGYLASMKVPAPTLSAWLAALAEFAGGILIAVGLLPRLAAIPLAITMLVAFGMTHHFSFDMKSGGSDYPLALAMVAIGLMFTGGGKYSLAPAIVGGSGPRA